ncbi:MAG: glycosyltransferase, partial [Candidatus Helarchaeota archaeon]
MKILVIIPTYNESQNIEKLIQAIFEQNIDGLEILIIDDNSPDGTGDIVENICRTEPRLHLMRREEKLGLGTAYVAGFKYALERDYDLIIEMDADFSHDPKSLHDFIEASKENDLTVGSRYVNGVNVINWPLSRLLLSIGASKYTRIITGLPLKD